MKKSIRSFGVSTFSRNCRGEREENGLIDICNFHGNIMAPTFARHTSTGATGAGCSTGSEADPSPLWESDENDMMSMCVDICRSVSAAKY